MKTNKFLDNLADFIEYQWGNEEEHDYLPLDDEEYMKLDEIGEYSYWIKYTDDGWDFNKFLVMKEDGDSLVTLTSEDEFNKAMYLFYQKVSAFKA